ncbi:hypothetical protein [Fuchsiella alkaliacetigena]|uniref:hypothetical protein n=1 Tax=Fuchsiella alkaliacetigena TaxID=957042 RepID=UPI00200B1F00|nr:hypothetical protein [Fuchsiella alkaliacetigena]MCK8825386.1 hypothetical protein [Fuchsiella alkaliacetigena]
MKNLKILTLTLALLILLTPALMADDVDFSGTLRSDLIVDEDGNMESLEKFNLILEQEFGFDADLQVDLEFRLDEDYTLEAKIREAYLDYYTLNSDWRIGKQTINWGSGYKLQPTDYFNPQDIRDLKPLDEKLGVKAVQNTYYTSGGTELSGVVVPFFKGSLDLRELEQQAQLLADEDDFQNLNYDYPEHELENIQAGAKLTQRGFRGYDVSFSAYHGYDTLPVISFTEEPSENFISIGEDKIPANMAYPEVNKVGFDIIGDINNFGVWLETTYNHYDDYDNGLEATFGGDYTSSNDLYFVAQGYYNEGRNEFEDDIRALNLHASKPVFTFHEVELTTLYDLESESYLIEPQFNYSVVDSVDLKVGGRIVENKLEAGGFGEFLGDDQFYARLQADF